MGLVVKVLLWRQAPTGGPYLGQYRAQEDSRRGGELIKLLPGHPERSGLWGISGEGDTMTTGADWIQELSRSPHLSACLDTAVTVRLLASEPGVLFHRGGEEKPTDRRQGALDREGGQDS
jgi:hypothetical protein